MRIQNWCSVGLWVWVPISNWVLAWQSNENSDKEYIHEQWASTKIQFKSKHSNSLQNLTSPVSICTDKRHSSYIRIQLIYSIRIASISRKGALEAARLQTCIQSLQTSSVSVYQIRLYLSWHIHQTILQCAVIANKIIPHVWWILALRVVVFFHFQKLLMAVSCHYIVLSCQHNHIKAKKSFLNKCSEDLLLQTVSTGVRKDKLKFFLPFLIQSNREEMIPVPFQHRF